MNRPLYGLPPTTVDGSILVSYDVGPTSELRGGRLIDDSVSVGSSRVDVFGQNRQLALFAAISSDRSASSYFASRRLLVTAA